MSLVRPRAAWPTQKHLASSLALLACAFLLHPIAAHAENATENRLPGETPSATSPREPAETVPTRQPIVVVLVPKDEPSLLPLLRAELSQLDLEVIEIAYALDSPLLSDPSTTTLERDRAADFRIVLRRHSIEVILFDPKTNERTLREAFASATSSPVEARTAVLHAVELLRWSLRDREDLGRARPKPVEVRAAKVVEPESPTPEKSHAWYVGIAPLALYSPGGANLAAGLGLDLTYAPGTLGLRLRAGTSLWPSTLSQTEGSAEVTPRFIGLQGVLSSLPVTSHLGVELGAGLDVVSVRLRGTTALPLRTHDDQLLTVAPGLSLHGHYSLGDSAALVLGLHAWVPFKSSRIVFAEREVGTYGRFIGVLGLGLRAFLD